MAISTVKDCADIVNESLRSLGYEYQIDTTNATTIEAGLNKVGAFAPDQRNAVMKQMNLIVQARNYGLMFNSDKNAFRRFLVDLEEGFGIEDIFHELIEGIDPLWDGAGTTQQIVEDLYGYDTNKIDKIFHTSAKGREFKTTIDRRNYDKVFLPSKVTRYVDTKLANLGWSAEVWLMNIVIGIIKDMIANNHIVYKEGYNPNTEDGVAKLVEDINATTDGFLTPSKLYNLGVLRDNGNYEAVANITNSKEDIFIITTPEFMRRLKTRGYSNAFNLSEFELSGQIMYLPAGTSLGTHGGKEVLAVALDRRSILCGIKTWTGTSKFIENTLCMNHFLLTDLLIGYNTFFNCVAFTGDELGDYSSHEGGNLIVYVTSNTDAVGYSFEIDGAKHTLGPNETGTYSFDNVKSASFPTTGGAGSGKTIMSMVVNDISVQNSGPFGPADGEYVFDNLSGTTIVSFSIDS